MMTGGYEMAMVAAEWGNILQGAQVAIMHSVKFAVMGLAGLIAICGCQWLRFALTGQN